MSIGKPNLKTFCPAAWFQVRNENDGDKFPCCKIIMDNDTPQDPMEMLNCDEMIDIKKKLHTGIRPHQCRECWVEEDNGFKSQRQNMTQIITGGRTFENSWLSSYFKNKQDYNSEFITSADICIGNTCNFQCVMCHPGDSSMIYNDWIKRQDSEFVKEKLEEDKDYFKKLKDQGYKNPYYKQYIDSVFNTTNNLLWLRLLGGEPLLDKKLLEKIKDLPNSKKNKLKLSFITNGSVDLKKTLEYIDSDQFDLVQFSISLEGIGPVQEYARYGSNWSQIEENILCAKKYADNVQLNLGYVIQTVTILRLQELLNWASQHEMFFCVSPCFRPEYLSLKSLPNELRLNVIENLKKFKDVIKQNPNSDEGLGTLNGEQFIKFLENPEFDFNQASFEKFLRYIKWYEEPKQIPTLTEIIPEWGRYFK